MAILRKQNVPLSELSTFRLGGVAREVVVVENEADLLSLFTALPKDQKWFLLGGGSNIIFPDGDCDTLIILLGNKNIHLKKEGDTILLVADGGTKWDDVVAYAVANGLSGIEALSAIPGTAGATPVQNVGAYGVEIKDVLVSLRAFDVREKKFVTFSNSECKFAYRDSMFKHEGNRAQAEQSSHDGNRAQAEQSSHDGKGRYIITEITLALSDEAPNVPQYPGVADYLAEKNIRKASLLDIRNAITTIRWKKLPDPSRVASVGSFFKNAFVTTERAEKLLKEFPMMKTFPGEAGMVKIPAGWLIESVGFKGKNFGTLSVYPNNALVLVNEGGASRDDLAELIAKITAEVERKYGIMLEPEPELLEF